MARTDTTDNLRELRPRPSREEIDPVASELLRTHGAEVMASAQRWADSPEDAEDAYQRGMEILLLKAPSIDPDHLIPWLKTVVKHEAWAIRRQRERQTPPAGEHEELDSPGPATAHDQAERIEQLRRGAEALARLKPNEVRALLLKAEGLSYQEICDETGWTYTKVNRALAEGRKAFAARLEGIQSGAECARLAPVLSAVADGEAGAEDLALLRPHLRTCLACRARLREYRAAPAKVAALVPGGGFAVLAWLRDAFHGLAAHKLAAAAASTAVLAGGSAATVATIEAGSNRPEPRPAVSRPAEPRRAATPAPLTVPPRDERSRRRRPAAAAPARAKKPAGPQGPATPSAPDPPTAAGEFGTAPHGTAPAAREEPRAPAAPAADGGEFAP